MLCVRAHTRTRVRKGIDPFQNLLAPALFNCFREKTRFNSNA
jgi:hypothetical protein